MNRHGANGENNGLLGGSDWEELNEYPSRAGSHSPSLRSDDAANAKEDETRSASRTRPTPRTPMKVHFDIPRDDDSLAEAGYMNGGDAHEGRGGAIRNSDHLDDDDDRHDDDEGHDAPLLPSASTPIDSALENPDDRPTSSLQAAISNMSNSILGAGIIGQPYALKEAGLAAGVTLLVVLTVVVDWTIRLIVINSKMSGRNTFQGTVEFCFGWWGLLAISFAQWAFAFGGMVAFAVIVGDSIPPVIEAIWPGMKDIRYLGWLAGRSGAIVVFIGCISWPLSLYRDISKVSADPGFLIREATASGHENENENENVANYSHTAGKSEHIGVIQYVGYHRNGSNAGILSPRRATRNVRFTTLDHQRRHLPSHRRNLLWCAPLPPPYRPF